MSFTLEESDAIKEQIADLFVSEISDKADVELPMPTRVAVHYFRVGERGLCGSLSLYVTTILDRGFRMIPFKYVERVLELLKQSEKSAKKPRGKNIFRCCGVSSDYERIVFRITFENLRYFDLSSSEQDSRPIRPRRILQRKACTSWIEGKVNYPEAFPRK